MQGVLPGLAELSCAEGRSAFGMYTEREDTSSNNAPKKREKQTNIIKSSRQKYGTRGGVIGDEMNRWCCSL